MSANSGSDKSERWWLVITPVQWEMYDIGLGDGTGPSEPWRECALVKAPNAKAAKWEAWRIWKRLGSKWAEEIEDWHPLHGVTAEPWDGIPSETERKQWLPYVSEAA